MDKVELRTAAREEGLLAQSRWKLLSKVLMKDKDNKNFESECLKTMYESTMSRETYGLFKCNILCANENDVKGVSGHWFRYSCDIQPDFSLLIRHVSKRVSLDDLVGFNNTGNVCVWPSEETLAYYCLKHRGIFHHKTVLEVGGGMTCLAALTVTLSSNPASVCCTDGNPASVDNIERILNHNKFDMQSITCQVLDWKDDSATTALQNKWDVILCADCLFFDDARPALVDFLFKTTSNDGLVLVMAPRRGNTLELFLQLCQGKFQICLEEDYDSVVTLLHQKKLKNPNYNPNVNYPLLVQLRKR